MKCFLTGFSLILILFFGNACNQNTQNVLKQDSLSSLNHQNLAGQLYFFAPEFDTTHLVATGSCDCCSANIAFLDDSCFLSIDYCEEGCSYIRGNYTIDQGELRLNYDSITVEKFYPEPDSLGESPADFVYNTIIHKPNSRFYKKNEFKGRIIFVNDKEFGAIDTAGSIDGMMKSVRAQGIWDRLNADPKSVAEHAVDQVNPNMLGAWAVPGERNASFQILEKTIRFLDQPKKYAYTVQNDSLKIEYDNYETAFLVSMKGSDTLIFEGDDRQVYYRFKKLTN